ncbi:WD40 repeat domain-containing protein [Methylocapsa sp. S129]|uniref:WD40 repeat domain-containing protein n=1 Tax=Methylocapsa sp. S129 TaxID=1641869 RepID=UPI00131E8544|nr:WD40 repeat domain-containing protein [Methylocapsa sp. S129]
MRALVQSLSRCMRERRQLAAYAIIASVSATVACGLSEDVRAQDAAALVKPPSDASSLSRLRLVRTLTAPNEHYLWPKAMSGTWMLAWSPDGQRVAAYARNGAAIEIWSSDGTVRHELPRYNNSPITESNVLGFLSGHSQILVGPSASDPSNLSSITGVAMSVLDADTGKVIKNIPGLNPDGRWQENIVWKAAISPDQKFVATSYFTMFNQSIERRIGIYSTDDWRLVTKVHFGDESESPAADAIAFSPDGKMLAIAYGGQNSRIDLIEVGSWKIIRTISTFSDLKLKFGLNAAAVNFSRDGSMVSVITHGGGVSWRYPGGSNAPEGVGVRTDTGIPDPLRVFRVSDGGEVASVGGFTGGDDTHLMAWSPRQDFIAFLDVHKVLYFWDPTTKDSLVKERPLESSTTSMLFSPDGSMIAQGFGDGVHLYQVENGI